MCDKYLRPGLRLGNYPLQHEIWPDALERFVRQRIDAAKFYWQQRRYQIPYIVNKVNNAAYRLHTVNENELQAQIRQLLRHLHQHGLKDEWVFQAFAIIREVSQRILGKKHYDVQLLGGWVMINGMVAEMETGQGKTLTATLPACTAALAGIPVHVLTANDYLATRDEQWLRPLYRWLGLSSAAVTDGMENQERTNAYRCDIVHSTSQQIAFDYLRDRMEMGDEISKTQIQYRQIRDGLQHKPSPYLLRGLCFAIVDEADSLLIDEAKTPLIISQTRQNEEQARNYFDALYLAASLDAKADFSIDKQHQTVTLTSAGKQKIENLVATLGEFWQRRRQREYMTTLALRARFLFHRDEHYLVRDDKVVIVDPLTGRVMPDRSWEHGLHQLIEAKEGCTISGERDPLARISFQRFFKRYLRLGGMSGTVTEVSSELLDVYGLRVIRIPTHQPSRRILMAEKVYRDTPKKWVALLNRVRAMQRQGRPVLIGTSSVAESEMVSKLLEKHGLSHQVLNARQDQREAELIARAGQLHCVTVATNMAGRGTDIALGDNVEKTGGLHVICTERNTARRIDRQLYGRCARQGDPGSAEGYMSLQDASIADFYPSAILKMVAALCRKNKPLPTWIGTVILMLPQKRMEYQHYRQRQQLMKQERQRAKSLAFTGHME